VLARVAQIISPARSASSKTDAGARSAGHAAWMNSLPAIISGLMVAVAVAPVRQPTSHPIGTRKNLRDSYSR